MSRMISRRNFIKALGLFTAASGMAACSAQAASTAPASTASSPAAGSGNDTIVVNIARGGDTVTMDPIFAGDNVDIWLMNLVFEGLTRSTADGKTVEPCLATSWDVSEDSLTYTFHLRENVKFSDGTPVKAEDWEYSLKRSLTEGAWSSLIASISDVKVVDEKTISILLCNPSASLLSSLAGFFCTVVPKDYYSVTDADTLASKPIGTGPFYLESWTPAESMCFKKNAGYWDTGYPLADEVNFLVVADDNTRLMQLQAGQVDVITDISAQMRETAASTKGIEVVDYDSTHIEYVSMNYTCEKLSDTRVRQALNYATNKDDINKAVFGGMGTPCTSFVWPTAPHFNPDLPTYDYDPEKAKALLAEAGVSDLTLDIIVTTGSPADLMEATILKDQWAKVGVTLNIEQMDSSARREKRNNLTFEVLLNYFTSDITDTAENMEMFCIKDNYDCWHLGWNGARQEEAERLVKEAGATNDETVRTKDYDQAQEIFAEEALIIPLCCVPSTVAMKDSVSGFEQGVLGNYFFNKLTIAQ